MTSTYFDKALALVLAIEGGYSNHPTDPGGATNFGITQAVYNEWNRRRGYAEIPASMMKRSEAAEIYHDIWVDIRAAEMPWPLNAMYFDAAVNHGKKNARLMVQRALGVTVDGVIGPHTIAAALAADGAAVNLLWQRLRFYQRLKTFNTFGRGWVSRILTLKQFLEEQE